ncbi:MAG: nucleotidyltransferase [Candidatus Pacebacteria bacterium]|nr:nucleotidyltransferase [Candidatus Paceibacterota bacterium]
MINDANLEKFISKFPLFLPTIQKLNEASVDWMIGGSGCLFLLGNNRIPDDADIYIPDDQHDTADELFGIESYTYTSPVESVRNSNPEGNHSLQLTSHLEFNIDKTYKFSITDTVKKKIVKLKYEDINLFLLPPEDVLLIKALLQRGPKEGKNDIEDIKTFMAVYKIDMAYLDHRVKELDAEERVGNIFK